MSPELEGRELIYDWNEVNAPPQPTHRVLVTDETLRRQMRLLQVLGVRHYGYYPEDFVAGRPDIARIRPFLSLATHPYPRP